MSWYREINVEKLKNNPVVKAVDRRSIRFTLLFRIQMFEKWKAYQTLDAIKNELEKVGILEEELQSSTIEDISKGFKFGGYPIDRYIYHPENVPGYKETNPLILSGKYYRKKKGFGLVIDPEFRQELKKTYPDISVEEKMRLLGIDPLDVGYNRIHRLEQEFNREMSDVFETTEGPQRLATGTEVTSASLMRHPYVKTVEHGKLYMTETFYNETCMIPVPLSKLFETYGIDDAMVSDASKMRIYSTLLGWTSSERTDFAADKEVLMIQKRRAAVMHQSVRDNFRELGKVFGLATIDDQRSICRWIDTLPRDPWGCYTRKSILAMVGISKSRYYALLNDEDYGMGSIKKAARDEDDVAVIRKVLDYKGFEKGLRQVYMLMPKVTGYKFSVYRIRRIMNKYGIRTNIRRPSRNRKAMRELIERNKKANLVMRRFKLHRPNEVRLTDVTYLDYGDGKRAYGSASVDPVTGRLICFVVSDNNDLKLALDTLAAMDSYPAKSGAILHSDQGILYMTDDFQAAVIERELKQSMSRRGNCWDNAVQESFFGHFKDECRYEKCKDLKELQKCLDEYSYYYNNERGMWDRGKMTPAEYEEYLCAMTEEEFSAYLEEEEQRFVRMKENSVKTALQAAKDYKEFTEKALGEKKNEDIRPLTEI